MLAIDLSLASLGYAIRKTKELGFTNLRYAQGDILALGGGKTFDIIDSSGVLHHLKEPLTGWRKLADLLRPGGLMHIGLYSAAARRDINTARDLLAKQGRGYSVDEVRRVIAKQVAEEINKPEVRAARIIDVDAQLAAAMDPKSVGEGEEEPTDIEVVVVDEDERAYEGRV